PPHLVFCKLTGAKNDCDRVAEERFIGKDVNLFEAKRSHPHAPCGSVERARCYADRGVSGSGKIPALPNAVGSSSSGPLGPPLRALALISSIVTSISSVALNSRLVMPR